MECNISTGYVSGPLPPQPHDPCVVKSPGKQILFDMDSSLGMAESPYFSVEPGNAVLIDTYNMVEDLHIYTERLVITSQCQRVAPACDPFNLVHAVGITSELAAHERMSIGGDAERWSLIKYSDEAKESRLQMLVALPGTYRLVLEDPSAQLAPITDLRVEYMKFDMAKMPYLPAAYFAGVKL